MFIQSSHANIYFNELPKEIIIDNVSYKLLCATIYTTRHFLSIFEINNQAFLVDDLNQSMIQLATNQSFNSNKATTVSLYYEIWLF